MKIGTSKKKIGRKKPSPRKVLVDELDGLWKRYVYQSWNGKCAMCGQAGTQAHHFFGRKACPSVRWNVNNGVLLCFTCHIRKVHQKGLTEPAREALIGRIGEVLFDELRFEAYKTKKFYIDDLRHAKSNLNVLLGWEP